jgi:hypothetical protein
MGYFLFHFFGKILSYAIDNKEKERNHDVSIETRGVFLEVF